MKTYQGFDAKVHHVWANMAPPGLDWNSRCHSSFAYLLRSVLPETTGFFLTTPRFYPKENPSDPNRFFLQRNEFQTVALLKPFWNNTGGVCLTQTWTTETRIPLEPRPDVKESHFMDRKKTQLLEVTPFWPAAWKFPLLGCTKPQPAARSTPSPSVAGNKLVAFTEDRAGEVKEPHLFFHKKQKAHTPHPLFLMCLFVFFNLDGRLKTFFLKKKLRGVCLPWKKTNLLEHIWKNSGHEFVHRILRWWRGRSR